MGKSWKLRHFTEWIFQLYSFSISYRRRSIFFYLIFFFEDTFFQFIFFCLFITNHFYEHSLLLFVLLVDFAFEEGGCGTLKFLLLRFPVPPDVECLPTYAAGGPFTWLSPSEAVRDLRPLRGLLTLFENEGLRDLFPISSS